MSEDPCVNERENYDNAVTQAVLAIGAGAVAAPASLGLSIIAGALLGAALGLNIAAAQKQLARCLREHGLSAQADILEETSERLEQELAALASEAEANSAVA